MPMFCPRCGTQNFETAQVCQNCSTPLPNRPPSGGFADQGQGYQAPQPPAYQQPQPPAPPAYQQPQPPPPQYQQPQPPPAYQQAPPPPPYQQAPSPYTPAAYGGYQPAGAGFGGAQARQYGSVGKRIAAYIIDYLLIAAAAIPGYILIFVGSAASSTSSGGGSLLATLGLLLVLVGCAAVGIYNIYLLGRDGATLGKKWMKLVVLDLSGNPLGFGKAFLRELVKYAANSACIILAFWPLWDKEQQGLHDKVFSTHVYEA